jgi:hypothetical protein
MLSIKNIVLAKINKRYIDRKIYIYKKNIQNMFSGLMTLPKNFLRPKNYF